MEILFCFLLLSLFQGYFPLQEEDADDLLVGATEEQLSAFAREPAVANLSPSYPVLMESCGPNMQARFYPFSGTHTASFDSIRTSYFAHVVEYQKTRESLRRQMVESGQYKSLNMLVVQW